MKEVSKLHKVLQFLFVDGVSIPIPKFLTGGKVLYLGFPKTALYMVPGFLFCYLYVKSGEELNYYIQIAFSLFAIGLFSFFYFKLFPKQFKTYSDQKILDIIQELKDKGIIVEMPPGHENWSVSEFRKWLNNLGLKLK